MIDPNNIVKYDYSDAELEELLIFCICVAGKTAKTIARRVDILYKSLQGYSEEQTPLKFPYKLPDVSDLKHMLKSLGIGCYSQKVQAIQYIALDPDLDLRTCTIERLEEAPYIGPKTSRFFLMSSRPSTQYAALDTHLLKWLKEQGVERVPKSTPTGKNYLRLESEFLSRVPKNMTAAEFDLKIWKQYSK